MARRSLPRLALTTCVMALLGSACAPSAASVAPSASPPGSPLASPTERAAPSPTPTAGLPALPTTSRGLEPGAYGLGAMPVALSVTVPDGWDGFTSSAIAAVTHDLGEVGESGLSFWLVRNVYDDPCALTLKDPPLGPGVDELAAALTSIENFEATTPTEGDIAGLPATSFELTGPVEPRCEMSGLWRSLGDSCRCLADSLERNRIWILEIEGVRVLIDAQDVPSTAASEGTPTDVLTELDAIIESIALVPSR